MAVTTHPTERNPHAPGAAAAGRLLQPDITRLAGLASLALILLNVVGLILLATFALTDNSLSDAVVFGVLLPVLAVAVAVVAASVALLRGGVRAQRVLLVVWSVLAAGVLAFLLGTMLMRVPDWMTALMPAWGWITTAAIELVLSVGATALLVESAAPGTRLRYGTMVSVSVVAAVLLVIVANVVAQTDPIQWDIQALGRFGVSDWTRTILKDVTKPIRITCVYTSTDKNRRASDYRPRTWDYLEQFAYKARKAGKKIEIASITTDNGKAKTIQRFQDRRVKESSELVTFLKGFPATADELARLLADEQKYWAGLGEDSYLAQWQVAQKITGECDHQVKKLKELSETIQKKVSGQSLVDFKAQVEEVKRELGTVQSDLKGAVSDLKGYGQVHQQVGKNHAATLQALDAYTKAMDAAAKAIPADVTADQAKGVLEKFATAAGEALTKTQAATNALVTVLGENSAEKILELRGYWVLVGDGRRAHLAMLMRQQAAEIAQGAHNAQAMARLANVETMKQRIPLLRQDIQALRDEAGAVRKAAESALKALATLDEKSKALLDRADKGETFGEPLKKLETVLADIEKLPQGKAKGGGRELEGDNLIIVEVGEDFRVAAFDEVWPIQDRGDQFGPRDSEAPTKRLFNGDSAIASKILAMTHEPFATVYITYRPPFDRQMAWRILQMAKAQDVDIPPPDALYGAGSLAALRRRLEQANFDVRIWDPEEDLEQPDDKDRPRLLLVLPPSPTNRPEFPAQYLQPEHMRKIRAMVDSGIPAIFLTGWMPWPKSWSYPDGRKVDLGQVDDYLEEDWGVRVLSKRCVVAGIPDAQKPGLYRIASRQDRYLLPLLALSSFTDHPIGEPLRDQRMLWARVAPLLPVKDADGKVALPARVAHESLLRVPADRKEIWAGDYATIIKAAEDKEGGLIRPEAGDTRPPFDLALVARREENKPARLGATSFTVEDVTDWPGLVTKLTPAEGDSEPPSPTPARRIFDRLPPRVQAAMRAFLATPKDKRALTDTQKGLIVEGLNAMLDQPDLYVPKAKAPPSMPGRPPMPPPKGPWDDVYLGWEAMALLAKTKPETPSPMARPPANPPAKPLSKDDQRRFNRLAIEAALKDVVASSQEIKDVTVVVLSGGASFFDFIMDRRVPRITEDGRSSDPAPRANADVILSAAYLLSGNKKYIAAGPTVIKPIKVKRNERMILAGLFVGVLPLAVVGLGLGVMYLRRR